MLDPKVIREFPDRVRLAAKNKGKDPAIVDVWLVQDALYREILHDVENLRSKQNAITKIIGSDPAKRDKHREEANTIKKELKDKEQLLQHEEEKMRSLSLSIPNIPASEVPVGKDSSGNVVLRSWGEKKTFNFPVKDHITLASELDLIDFERGTKVGGFRSYFLKHEAALMELGLMMYTMSQLAQKGFTPVIAPSLVKEFTLIGTGQFPWGRSEVYTLGQDQLFLGGTAEIPVTAYHADEILQEQALPKKFVAFSPCFRREAGSYGKDTRGIYRLHQFNKVEQVVLCKNDWAESEHWHEELLKNSESILQALGLPYRVLLMCTGDMGEPQVKKYDIETYMPGREGYGETQSDSIMGEFQARRLNIRYKTKDGVTAFVHTLNNTAIASPRILVAILENYQQEDGSITVPSVLQPYVGIDVIRKKKS